eukprot:gene10770-biopygen8977
MCTPCKGWATTFVATNPADLVAATQWHYDNGTAWVNATGIRVDCDPPTVSPALEDDCRRCWSNRTPVLIAQPCTIQGADLFNAKHCWH